MNEDDKELEILKAKRLQQMQKNIVHQKNISELKSTEKRILHPREVILKKLGSRGLEVLEAAEYQYPDESYVIISKLSELILSGDIDEELDGGKLLTLFRSVGINIRLNTKINVKEDGKFVSLSDKFKTKDSDSSN